MSARFRFHRVLRVKRQLRTQAADELAALQRERDAVERAAAAATAAAAASRAQAAEAVRDGSSAADLHLHAAYERAQTAAAQRLAERAAAIEASIEERRAEVIARRTEERQFEVLEGRENERRAAAAEHVEAVAQDDLARGRPAGETVS